MAGQERDPQISHPPAKFEFVISDSRNSQHVVRQHVAKLNWRRRKEQKAQKKPIAPHPRTIATLPILKGSNSRNYAEAIVAASPTSKRLRTEPGDDFNADQTAILWGHRSGGKSDTASNGFYLDLKHTVILMSPSRKWKLALGPIQNELSPYHPLDSMDLDPFNSVMVLSRADQLLLHHWVNCYAIKAFGVPDDPTFSPLGNVYIPIDFSHRASVHGILAHSASHMAYLRGERTSLEALKHKAMAVQLVNLAMQDEQKAVSDENISAVLRLLTYERYWGTEEVWQMHRQGLNQMIKRRGGLSSLSGNWQLEARVHLVALLKRPNYKSLTYISPIPPDGSPESVDDTEEPHSDFMNFFSDINSVHPEEHYPAINRALGFLHSLAMANHALFPLDKPSGPQDLARLMCLFYIATIVKGAHRSHFNLLWLNDSLERTEAVWNNNVEILRWLLLQGVGRGKGGPSDIERTEKLKEIALLLNNSSYRKIEERLLDVLVEGPSNDPLLPCDDPMTRTPTPITTPSDCMGMSSKECASVLLKSDCMNENELTLLSY